MDLSFIIGIFGSIVLVIGSAYPDGKQKTMPIKSIKDRLFAIGGLIMLFYAILGYLQGGSVFFIFLEVLIVISCILMMLNTNDKFDTTIIGSSGIVFVVRSLFLFHGYDTILFIIGLILLSLGYAFKTATMRRDIMLTIGSVIIAIFSYIQSNRIFFILNLVFAIFSLYYTIKQIYHTNKKHIR